MSFYKAILILALAANTFLLQAQENTSEVSRGFKKANLFTGGNIQLSFSNNVFLAGASPILGYSLTSWADAGLAINYSYTRFRDYDVFNDKLKINQFGGGPFLKLYPFKFLFGQVQVERNFITQKYILPSGVVDSKNSFNVGSTLVGGGYCSGRLPSSGQAFYYLSVMFDVSRNPNSPYTDGYGRSIPIFTGGFQIPLFQKYRKNNNSGDYEQKDGRRKPRVY